MMMEYFSSNRSYVPVHIVFSSLPEESAPRLMLLHSLTGCDTRCFICGHSKKTALETSVAWVKVSSQNRISSSQKIFLTPFQPTRTCCVS